MKKRLLSAILSLCMLLTMAPTVAFAAEDDEGNTAPATSGTCGAEGSESSVTWKLTQNNEGSENPTYTLTISGSGAMADFTLPTKPDATGANVAPWYTALTADETTKLVPITEIKIDEGITGIGSYAFAYTKVAKAEFPSTASYYGKYIFRYCSELTTVDWTNYNPAPMDDT
ncbi:MAG: leucine-rich repeat protein, partial [Butyricicoccus sp.]